MNSQRRSLLFLRTCMAIALLPFLSMGHPLPLSAADFTVADGDVAGLVAAIHAANDRGAPTTIALAQKGDYLLTAPDPAGGPDGRSGLPSITGMVEIAGNGSVIRRSTDSAVPPFRILHVARGAEVTLSNLTITGGAAVAAPPPAAPHAGGLWVGPDAKVVLVECVVNGNVAGFLGGGIVNDGTMVVTNSTIDGNVAVDGAGIFNGYSGDLTVTDSRVTSNRGSFGGGLFNHNGGIVHLQDSVFTDNSVTGWGGAIATVGFGPGGDSGTVLVADRLSIHANRAAVGGGFFRNIGTAEIANSAIYANQASDIGGGIFNDEARERVPGQLRLTNSTVSGNYASVRGGGLFTAAPMLVDYSTFVENGAPEGGNIFAFDNALAPSFGSTIIARSQAGHDCSGPIVSRGHNLDSDGTCRLAAGGDIPDTDPKLGPLAVNGGPTQTAALLPGSPAIDAGAPEACPAADQRGVTRPQGPACDMGAYEIEGVFVEACGKHNVYESDGGYFASAWDGLVQVGDQRKNSLAGTTGPDLLLGLKGNDLLDGKGGDDVICGGEGNDLLLGKDGNDFLAGGRGNDVLNGGRGDYDQLLAGDGNDALLDGDGSTRAAGAAGNDTLIIALRAGWRSPEGETRFDGLAGGYGNDAVTLTIADPAPFVLGISGDEYDDPPAPREGHNDTLALSGEVDPASAIVKFEKQMMVAAGENPAPLDEDAGAQFLLEEGEEMDAGPESAARLFLPLLAP